MIKSMVVAIDSTDSSARAQDYALALAKQYNSELTGIAVLDVPWVTAPMATPIGGGYYKEHRDETLLEERRHILDSQINTFRAKCQAEGVPMRAIEVEGVPAEQIDHEADRHDLIVIGRETNFHGVKGQDIGDVAAQLLRDNPRPIVVVPPTAPLKGNGVAIAFDGSLQASRAMQMFHLMGLSANEPVHIISINANAEEAQAVAERGAEFFRSHGMSVHKHAIHASDSIADIVLSTVADIGASMLVMGAFGPHSLMHQIFAGSTTKQLVRASSVPVFVHH